jgi:hypothetical protein
VRAQFSGTVGPAHGHGFDHVGDCEDLGLGQDLVAAEPVRKAATVRAFVVLSSDLRHRSQKFHWLGDVVADLRTDLDSLIS